MVFVGLKLRCLNPFKAVFQIFSVLMLSLVVFVLICCFNSFSILETSLLCVLKCFFPRDQLLFDISGDKDIVVLLDGGSSRREQGDKLFWHIIFGDWRRKLC